VLYIVLARYFVGVRERYEGWQQFGGVRRSTTKLGRWGRGASRRAQGDASSLCTIGERLISDANFTFSILFPSRAMGIFYLSESVGQIAWLTVNGFVVYLHKVEK